MILDNSLNELATLGLFLSPDNRSRKDNFLDDFELGALYLNNPSGGLLQADWHVYNVGNNIYLNRLLGDQQKLIFSTSTIPTELTFAFDSNMQPQIAFVENNVVKFRWYDSVIENYTITEYSGIRSPRLALDDKRDLETFYRDVLFFYIKSGEIEKLCYRQQRDRYEIERELAILPVNTKYLNRFGIATNRRIQIEIVTDGPPQYA